MVQMNLSAKQKQKHREQMSGHQGGNKGGKNWEIGIDIYALLCINQIMRTYHISQCFWTVVLEETLKSPLDCKEIQPVHPKGNQSWIFIGRTDAEAETATLWPSDAKNWLTGKDPDAGKDWRQEEKGMTDEMVGWHHQLDGCEFEQAPGVGDGQGSLVCCSPWGSQRVRHDRVTELNCIAQGTLLRALWWPKWNKNPKKRGYIHMANSLRCKAEINTRL